MKCTFNGRKRILVVNFFPFSGKIFSVLMGVKQGSKNLCSICASKSQNLCFDPLFVISLSFGGGGGWGNAMRDVNVMLFDQLCTNILYHYTAFVLNQCANSCYPINVYRFQWPPTPRLIMRIFPSIVEWATPFAYILHRYTPSTIHLHQLLMNFCRLRSLSIKKTYTSTLFT